MTAPISLTINCTAPSGQIYYTLNGTEPTNAATLYTGPLTISSTSLVRAICYAPNYIPSRIVTQSYLFNIPAPYLTQMMIHITGDEQRYHFGPSRILSSSSLAPSSALLVSSPSRVAAGPPLARSGIRVPPLPTVRFIPHHPLSPTHPVQRSTTLPTTRAVARPARSPSRSSPTASSAPPPARSSTTSSSSSPARPTIVLAPTSSAPATPRRRWT